MTLIDGDRIITAQLYDDEHEEFIEEKMSIIDNINAYTTEGITEADIIRQTGWIPCSERLPEDRREVLVTAYWHETYQVMMASYYGDGLWWCVPFNNCGEHMRRLNPKAWMPLPQPYNAD